MAELDGVLYKEIVEQGLREFPNECCGLIAAVDGVPTKGFPMKNADASPATYRLDGTEQLRVFDQMERGGPRPVGDLSLTHAFGGISEPDGHPAGALPRRVAHLSRHPLPAALP